MKTLIKNMLFYWEDDIYRILAVASGTKAASEASASSETADNEILIINCNKRNMPQWVKISGLRKYSLCSEEELLRALPLRAECELSEQELLIAQTRYHIICGILIYGGCCIWIK